MGWRVQILQTPSGGLLPTGHAAGVWKIVPPADYSLSHEEARELARIYGWPTSTSVRMEGSDESEANEMTTPTDIKKVERGLDRLSAGEARRKPRRYEPIAISTKTDWRTIPRERWLTFPVAGAAYGDNLPVAATLTHSFDPETQTVLCGKVKPESILEDYSYDTKEAPTCEVCLKRLAKLKPSAAGESQKVAIRPFSGPEYGRRGRGKPDTTQCALCGKWIRDDAWRYTVHVLDGGARFASTQEEFDHGGGDEAGDMGVWPVGPDCAKVLKAAGVYVYNEKTKRAAEEVAGGECGCEHEGEKSAPKSVSTAEARRIGDRLGVDWRKVDINQFARGLVVEREHEDVTKGDLLITGRIALAHLKEDPAYYTKLDRAGLEAGEARHAADYPDLESALLGAQSKWDATHVVKQGDRITVFSPTSRGYKKRMLFRQGGNLHWPEMHSTVEDLPDAAVTIYEATKLGWEPEDVEVAPPMRRAAEAETKFKLGDHVIMLAGKQIGMGKLREDTPGEIDRIEEKKGAEGVFYGVSYVDRKGKRRHTYADAHELKRAAQENPVEAANGSSWSKLTRDPQEHASNMAKAAEIGPIKNAHDVYQLLAPELAKEDQEVFLVLPLDIRGQLRCAPIEVHRGARSRVEVSIPDVLRACLEAGGEGLCVCHNHPTTKATPSDADKDLTKAIRAAAEAVELAFVDHVVIGTTNSRADEYYSFEQKKLFKAKAKGKTR